jgi:hypothetical protein
LYLERKSRDAFWKAEERAYELQTMLTCADTSASKISRVRGIILEPFGRMAEWQNTSAGLFKARQNAKTAGQKSFESAFGLFSARQTS